MTGVDDVVVKQHPNRLEVGNATAESDEMLTLLQEKSVLKKLDEEYAANPKTDDAKKKYRERRRRHAEIGKEIVRLGKVSKASTE